MTNPKEAKTQVAKSGEVEEVTPEEVTPPPEPEAIVEKPSKVAGEGEKGPEDFEQKYKTLVGIHQQTTVRLSELEKERSDFGGMTLKIDQLAEQVDAVIETQGLMAESITSGADASEELQAKIQKAQQAREDRVARFKVGNETMGQIQSLYEAAGLKHDDEALKDAKEAFNKGDFPGALRLTVVAVKGKVATPEPTPEPVTKKPSNLKVLTKQAASPGAEGMSKTDKIKLGLAEKRQEQD